MDNRSIKINLIAIAILIIVSVINRTNYKVLNDTIDILTTERSETEELLTQKDEEILKLKAEVSSGKQKIAILEEELTEIKESTKELPLEYIGEYKCTAYCCERYPHICGGGNTASGQPIQAGVTVAAKSLPFGTVLYIEGLGIRIVQDRGGLSEKQLDIAVEKHSEAERWDNAKRKVYIIDFTDK